MERDQRAGAWRRAAHIASSREGQIRTEELRALGLSGSTISRAIRGGHVLRAHQGVVLLGHRQSGLRAACRAALLAAGDGSRLGYRTALEDWGLVAESGGPVHLIVARDQRYQRAGVIVHRPRELDPDDLATHDHLATTSVARALVDVAGSTPRATLEHAFSEAILRRLTTTERVLATLDRRPRIAGSRVLRQILGTAEARVLRSTVERRFLGICRAVEAEQDVLVNERMVIGGRMIEPDFCWPRLRLIVEIDGVAVHGTVKARRADPERDRFLQEHDWAAARFLEDEVLDRPDSIGDELLRLIAARGRHLSR